MADNSTDKRTDLVSHFQHMRRAAMPPRGNFEVLESPALEASIPEQQESTDEVLRKLVEKYFDNDPQLIDVAKKIVATGGEGLRMLSDRNENALRSDPSALAGLEAIIRTDGSRPSFLILEGEVDRASSPVGDWGFALDSSAAKLKQAIACVGRIDVPGSPAGFQGTGFLIADDLIVTNRHVLQVTARQQNGEWRFPDGAAIDFGREYRGRDSVNRRLLKRVVFCGSREIDYYHIDHSKLDLALIEIEPRRGAPLNPLFSVNLSTTWALPGNRIYTIGYPGSPPSSIYPPTLLEQLFHRTFGYKRLAPGEIIYPQTSVFNWTLAHDATTLGGNSGSVVIVMSDEEVAAGLHYGGQASEPRENWGHVISGVLQETDGHSTQKLKDILQSRGVRFSGAASPTTPAQARPPVGESQPHQGTIAKQPETIAIKGACTNNTTSQNMSFQMNGNTATWTIPLNISVTIGTPGANSGATAVTPPVSSPAAGMALIEAMRIPLIAGGLESRTGYDPTFLDFDDDVTPLLELTEAGKKIAARLEDDSTELKYHKFSVVMHKKRRLALFTAANVDWREASRLVNGRKPTRKELSGLGPNDIEEWITDERIPDAHQLPDLFFTKDGGAFDKGHLVRRDDVCWGSSFEDIQMSNGDTYHTTNCSPQVSSFNQSAKGEDNWGDLENMVQKQTKAEKAIIFSGPVLDPEDPVFVGREKRGPVRIQIPRKFWKIIVVNTDGEAGAYGFLLEQDISAVTTELVVPEQWKRYMARISEIEPLLNKLVKLKPLKAIDRYDTEDGHGLVESVSRR